LVTLGLSDLQSIEELGSRSRESLESFGAPGTGKGALQAGLSASFCFKVSASGRHMFGEDYLETSRLSTVEKGGGAPSTGESSTLTVQPNLEIITPPGFPLDLFYRILNFSEVMNVDVMTTLSISRESLGRGMERGLRGEEIIRALVASSRREIPETVLQLVEECGSRLGDIDVGLAGGYIVASDRMHVEEMRANPRIGRYIKDVFGEKVILLRRAVELEKVTKELQKLGFMPRVASESLHVTGEGLFHVTLRPEELYNLLAVLSFAEGVEEELEGTIFEDRLRSLIERLRVDGERDFNPQYYVEPLVKAFKRNFEKRLTKRRDEEKKRLKKQVNRLLTRVPKRSEPVRFKGENPTSDPSGITKLFRFAIEHETPVKIHYRRSTGEEIHEAIEPESMQGGRIYAHSPQDDEHHIYVAERILRAAL
jgi:hypothetical protein